MTHAAPEPGTGSIALHLKIMRCGGSSVIAIRRYGIETGAPSRGQAGFGPRGTAAARRRCGPAGCGRIAVLVRRPLVSSRSYRHGR